MATCEGTYLIWLDFRGTGLFVDEPDELLIHKAGLWLDSGKIFGRSGEDIQRINAACPRSVLAEAPERIRNALSKGGQSPRTYKRKGELNVRRFL